MLLGSISIPILRPDRGRLRWRGRLLLCCGLLAFGSAVGAPAEIQVARTVMPGAAPSSFAIGLPGGVSFCYDPVRGGLRYVWQGGFADLTPAWPEVGKFVKPVKLLSDIVYRESGMLPLRRGDPGREPVIEFKGYRLVEDRGIEFRYTVDGVPVREEISAPAEGNRLVRRFRIGGGDADARWWYVPGPTEGALLSSPTGERDNGGFRFDAGLSREFTLEIALPQKGT